MFLLITSISFSSFGATWKPAAKAVDCPHDVKVMAKEGEKHVLVDVDGKKYQLTSTKDEAFSDDALVSHEFSNKQEIMKITLPGYVERNPPKFDFKAEGKDIHCRMNLL